MPWTNNRRKGEGLVMNAGVLLAGTPVTGIAQDVAGLDSISFAFALTQVAATVVKYHFEGTLDGANYKRIPVNEDTSSPPDVTLDNGDYLWTRAAGKDDWCHANVPCSGLLGMKVVADSTGGTTDTLDVYSYGEAKTIK